MREVYLVDCRRTPIGVSGGSLRYTPPEKLAAAVMAKLWNDANRPHVDAIIGGNAVGTGGNLTRLGALYSELPESIPAWTLDMQCASALTAISTGYAQIAAGIHEVIIAGGMESASLQPLRTYAPNDERQGSYKTAQFSPGEIAADAMLRGAERAIQALGATREELDKLALQSHQHALANAQTDTLKNWLVPVSELASDECLRPRMRLQLLQRLPLLLGPGTHITAGNACLIHDGAAFAMLAGQEAIKRYHLRPLAKIIAVAQGASDPLLSPLGVKHVSTLVLQAAHLQMDDMDTIEWNEAFAIIDYLFEKSYPQLVGRYNPLGGALAYGHPYGASGAIILTHLLARLHAIEGRYGLCAIAGAGGTGCAMIVERCHE